MSQTDTSLDFPENQEGEAKMQKGPRAGPMPKPLEKLLIQILVRLESAATNKEQQIYESLNNYLQDYWPKKV